MGAALGAGRAEAAGRLPGSAAARHATGRLRPAQHAVHAASWHVPVTQRHGACGGGAVGVLCVVAATGTQAGCATITTTHRSCQVAAEVAAAQRLRLGGGGCDVSMRMCWHRDGRASGMSSTMATYRARCLSCHGGA